MPTSAKDNEATTLQEGETVATLQVVQKGSPESPVLSLMSGCAEMFVLIRDNSFVYESFNCGGSCVQSGTGIREISVKDFGV